MSENDYPETDYPERLPLRLGNRLAVEKWIGLVISVGKFTYLT